MRRRVYTIILDLDATIIHGIASNEKRPITNATKHAWSVDDWVFYERPHLQEFLDYIFQFFNVGVWTAASPDYADFIVRNIVLKGRPERKLLCLLNSKHENVSKRRKIKSIKDLSMLAEMDPIIDMKRLVIIDDNPDVIKNQTHCSYHITPFDVYTDGHEDDTELLSLMKRLHSTLITTCGTKPLARDIDGDAKFDLHIPMHTSAYDYSRVCPATSAAPASSMFQ